MLDTHRAVLCGPLVAASPPPSQPEPPCLCPGGFQVRTPGQPCCEMQECSGAGDEVAAMPLLSFLPSTAHPQLLALSFPSGLCSICLLEGCKGESRFMGAQRLWGNCSAAQPLHPCIEGGLMGPIFGSYVTKQRAFLHEQHRKLTAHGKRVIGKKT